jgi:hypothetical protein
MTSYAQATCGDGSSPDRREDGKVEGWVLNLDAAQTCRGGVRVDLQASRQQTPQISSGSGGGGAQSSFLSIPIYCRRDDYMFLPPNALGGLPCLDVPTSSSFDPYPLAVRLAASLAPPDLRIAMNPARGLVSVPTWFWIEGYDGGNLSNSESVLQEHEVCHTVAVRGAGGLAVLGSDGRPQTRQECHTEDTTFVVSVRLFPHHFAWDFGDKHTQDFDCSGMDDCGGALGQPFVDSVHPSPIQHPYVWSSLGVNGGQDAYIVTLAITFSAQYDVTVNGHDQGGWHGLQDRVLTWSAPHQVQEAQAVLTQP